MSGWSASVQCMRHFMHGRAVLHLRPTQGALLFQHSGQLIQQRGNLQVLGDVDTFDLHEVHVSGLREECGVMENICKY